MEASDKVHEEMRFFIRKDSEFTENKLYLTKKDSEGKYKFRSTDPMSAMDLDRSVAKIFKAEILERNDQLEKSDVEIVKASVQIVETEVLPVDIPIEYQN